MSYSCPQFRGQGILRDELDAHATWHLILFICQSCTPFARLCSSLQRQKSSGSVREALRVLEAEGLVATSLGRHSWLNQVENWFSRIQRDVITRGVFTSVKDLDKKLMRYIRTHNKNPKPIKWKYDDPNRRHRQFF